MRRLRLRTLAVVLALAFGLTASGCSTGTDAAVYGGSFTFVSPGGKFSFSYPEAERQTIGDLSGPDLAGDDTIAVSDFSDQVVVLNFWGSWCPPCRAEAPDLDVASRQLADQGVQFLGINVKDNKADGADFLASKEIGYPSIFDPTMRTLLSLRGYPASSIPSTIVLDRQHRVAQIWLRSVSEEELVATVAAIATEPTS